MSSKLVKSIELEALTTITGASGELEQQDGKTVGILTLDTGSGTRAITIEQFDAIYRGMVTCWPAVKPLKDQLLAAKRDETKAEKAKEREAAKEAKKAEREAAKATREKEQADKKAAKEAADKAAKEAKEKAAKEAAEAKKKADAVKAKAAADAKAKADKAAGATTAKK